MSRSRGNAAAPFANEAPQQLTGLHIAQLALIEAVAPLALMERPSALALEDDAFVAIRLGLRLVFLHVFTLGLQVYLLRFGMTGPEHGTHPSPTFSEGTTGALGLIMST